MMPNILAPSSPYSRVDWSSLGTTEYRYKYPNGLALKPGTPLHDRLRDEIFARARASREAMSNRYDSWRKIDKSLTAYIPADEEEDKVKELDDRRPVSIVMPTSYAALEVMLAYMTSAFLDPPIFRYEGVSEEDIYGAMLLERVVGIQSHKFKMAINLHTMFRDSMAYGIGVISPTWTRRYGKVRVERNRSSLSLFGGGNGPRYQDGIRIEGNKLRNIDPYNYLPDPNYPAHAVQDSEFNGWLHTETRMAILGREQYDRDYFNAKYLEHISGGSILTKEEQSDRDRYSVQAMFANKTNVKHDIDLIWMNVNLVPAEWGLGGYKYPQKWLFGLAGDQVIIHAKPDTSNHGLFQTAVCSPDFDGYSVAPISRLEANYGIQEVINFLYNSHVANVRKAINDVIVADPTLINLKDLTKPTFGAKIVRTKRKAWGQGVEGGIKQLDIRDVTANNVQEALTLMRVYEEGSSAVDSLKGTRRQSSERVTASEFQGTQRAALSRFERSARMASVQAMQDLGDMIASNTQQYMTRDAYVEVAGRYEERLREELGDENQRKIRVSPFELDIGYDVGFHDGTLPTSGDPALWATMIQMALANPEAAAQLDTVRMFKHWARLSGAKNVDDFVRRNAPEVRSDEAVARDVERGDLIPA